MNSFKVNYSMQLAKSFSRNVDLKNKSRQLAYIEALTGPNAHQILPGGQKKLVISSQVGSYRFLRDYSCISCTFTRGGNQKYGTSHHRFSRSYRVSATDKFTVVYFKGSWVLFFQHALGVALAMTGLS